jgi:hypothetical protein
MTTSNPETPAVTNSKATISKRLGSLVVVGGIPSAVIGVLGDLLTPRGGWIVVGLIGSLAVLLALILILILRLKSVKESNIYKKIASDSDSAWILEGQSAFTVHIVHVVLVFSLICLFVSAKSYAASSDGGVLARNVPAVSDAQKQLGLSEKILIQQTVTNEKLTEIKNVAIGLKKESSEDPRKELLNLGLKFDGTDFLSSVSSKDYRAIDLYLKAGFDFSNVGVAEYLYQANDEKSIAMLSESHYYKSMNCSKIYLGSLAISFPKTIERKDLFSKLCKNSLNKERLAEIVRKLENEAKATEIAIRDWDASKKENEARLQDCVNKNGDVFMPGFSLPPCHKLFRPLSPDYDRKKAWSALFELVN